MSKFLKFRKQKLIEWYQLPAKEPFHPLLLHLDNRYSPLIGLPGVQVTCDYGHKLPQWGSLKQQKFVVQKSKISVDKALIPADNLEENIFHASSDFFKQTAPLRLWQHSNGQGHDHPSSLLHVHIAFSVPRLSLIKTLVMASRAHPRSL